MVLTIKSRTIYKSGNSYVITIPKTYMDDEHLSLNQSYTLTIEQEQEE